MKKSDVIITLETHNIFPDTTKPILERTAGVFEVTDNSGTVYHVSDKQFDGATVIGNFWVKKITLIQE